MARPSSICPKVSNRKLTYNRMHSQVFREREMLEDDIGIMRDGEGGEVCGVVACGRAYLSLPLDGRVTTFPSPVLQAAEEGSVGRASASPQRLP